MRDILKINMVPEKELEKFKAVILKEYGTYWNEKNTNHIDICRYDSHPHFKYEFVQAFINMKDVI